VYSWLFTDGIAFFMSDSRSVASVSTPSPSYSSGTNGQNLLQQHLLKVKKALLVVFGFSFCVNLLGLITPLYSLQILDRVLGSGNLDTLLMLSLIMGLIHFVIGLLQIARSFTLIKIGVWLDSNISHLLFRRVVAHAAVSKTMGGGQILRDFQVVKMFLTSVGINTIFDAPWTVAYLIALYLIHPYMCVIAVVGAVLIVSFAFFNAFATKSILQKSTENSNKSVNNLEMATRNAEVIESMGMMTNVTSVWRKYQIQALDTQCIASYRNGIISNISGFIRSAIQMAVTAFAALVIVKTQSLDMTTGGMIASSILVGKALAPFNNFIGLWQNINDAIKAYGRVNAVLDTPDLRDLAMPIAVEQGVLVAEKVFYYYPAAGSAKYTLQDVSFIVEPGEILAIIGASASGKSTMAKLLTGIWKPTYGTIRVDGLEVYKWHRETFGAHIGYLPQDVELFNGTVSDNIARMSAEFDPEDVISAAKAAGAHELISRLQDGYDTDVGIGGSKLSGGQRQRIALARAFYGKPKLLVLDEPNASLDTEGEEALAKALIRAKESNISSIFVSHRSSILPIADKILVLNFGVVTAYGPAQDVLASMVSEN
jgi:PrtD family type I secretion system ABC transporter